MKKLRIGFIGNFQAPHSTENERKWSFEKLGHEVLTFQENEVPRDKILGKLVHREIDLLLYSHTHGWKIPDLKGLFEYAKIQEIPTASVHLDRWAWLARASDVGKEATWFTEYLFMADFSPEAQELYKKHDINAYYLRPGVVERDCFIARSDHVRFPHEIVFVGSKGYHSEYRFRPAMIDFLQKTYGSRFGLYGNDGIRVVRGSELNTLYATAKIIVGDSCFGGRPRYTSDRYYEVRGRGGFLLHPHVEGVDTVGVAHYGGRGNDEANLQSLKYHIDYYLDMEHSFEREGMRKIGYDYVKSAGTYTIRAQEMLNVIFGGKQ